MEPLPQRVVGPGQGGEGGARALPLPLFLRLQVEVSHSGEASPQVLQVGSMDVAKSRLATFCDCVTFAEVRARVTRGTAVVTNVLVTGLAAARDPATGEEGGPGIRAAGPSRIPRRTTGRDLTPAVPCRAAGDTSEIG